MEEMAPGSVGESAGVMSPFRVLLMELEASFQGNLICCLHVLSHFVVALRRPG